jgi:hypothetical protein
MTSVSAIANFNVPFSLLGNAMILALSSGLLILSETTPVIVWVWEKENVEKRSRIILVISRLK